MKRFFLALLAVACGPVFAQAAVATSGAVGSLVVNATAANQSTFGFGTSGTVIQFPTAATDGGTGVKVSGSAVLTNPAGNRLTVATAGRVSNAVAAQAIGRFLGRVVGTTFKVAGYYTAVKQLMSELNYTPVVNPADGTLSISKVYSSRINVFYQLGCGLASCPMGTRDKAGGDAVCRYVYGSGAHFEPTISDNACANASNAYLGAMGKGYGCYKGEAVAGDVSSNSAAACPSGYSYSEYATMDDFTNAIANASGWPSTSNLASALVQSKESLQGLDKPDAPKLPVTATPDDLAPLNVVNPLASGPATSPGRVTTQTSNNPDGSQRQETVTCQYQHSYNGASVVTTESCSVAVLNDGASGTNTNNTTTNNAPSSSVAPLGGAAPVPAPAPASQPASAPQQQCGLAGQPTCGVTVDSTGAPDVPAHDPDQAASDAYKDTQEWANDPTGKLPKLPELRWDFQLPSACSAIDLGDAFAPYLTKIDVCQFQPVFHDIMSVVWTIGVIFGFIATFWRSTYSSN